MNMTVNMNMHNCENLGLLNLSRVKVTFKLLRVKEDCLFCQKAHFIARKIFSITI